MKDITFAQLRSAILDLPELDNLVALLCMCAHPLMLEPAPVEGHEPIKCPIRIYDKRQECRVKIEEVLTSVKDLWKPVAKCEMEMVNMLGKDKAAGLLPLMDKHGRPTRQRMGH